MVHKYSFNVSLGDVVYFDDSIRHNDHTVDNLDNSNSRFPYFAVLNTP